jgi:hypothetical protein
MNNKLSIYKGAFLEYLGGHPDEAELGIKKGELVEIIGVEGEYFVIKDYSLLNGEACTNYSNIHNKWFDLK